MRAATRMMMISALGEDRNRMDGGQMYNQRMEQENEMRRNEMYGEQRREMHGREPPYEERMNRRYARRYARQEMMPESRYEAHWDEDQDIEAEELRRRMEREMRRSRSEEYDRPQGRGGMYSAHDNPMGFKSRRKKPHDDDEEELSGSFRYRATARDVSEDLQEEHPLNEMQVKKWLKTMQNKDGTMGAHFGKDSAETIRGAHCPKCDELEFYAAINMIYSNYCKVAKDMGVDRPEFYAFMAKAFLEDKNAEDDKLLKYMRHVAGKK